jgi:hypothetical protein
MGWHSRLGSWQSSMQQLGAQSSGVQTSVDWQASCSEIAWSPAPNVCRSEYHLQALYSGVTGRKGNGATEMALNISATMRNLKANSIAYARYTSKASVCQWPHCLCTNSARSARPTATSQWREVRTIQKRLVIRIWKRCKCRQYKLYASCASIFTDKFVTIRMVLGRK